MACEERRLRIARSLKRQLHSLEQRLDCHPHLLIAMHELYARVPPEQRHDFVLHWPLDCEDAAAMTLVPFRLVALEDQEHVYYEFLLAQERRVLAPSPSNTKKPRLTEPPLEIRMLPWLDSRSIDDFRDACPASGPNAQFAEQRVSALSHKLHSCTLPPVAFLTMSDIEGGCALQLGLCSDDDQEPHRLVVTNCVVRLCARECFRGLTLYMTDQPEPITLDYDTLCAAGHLDLDLRQLSTSGRPCRLVTRSPLMLWYPPGQAHCCCLMRSASPSRLELHGSATLQYLVAEGHASATVPLQPYRYCIDTDAVLMIATPSPVSETAPKYDELRIPRGGFSQATDRYCALQRLQMHCDAGPVPRFVLDQECLPVVLSHGQCRGMLVWKDRTFARFAWDALQGMLTLGLVLPEDSQPVNALKHFVY